MKIILVLGLMVLVTCCLGQANRNELVIDEIMADPSPQAKPVNGLPEAEFIEIKNNSQRTINLNGWKISDANTTATITTNFMLLPDSFVTIGSMTTAVSLSSFGRSIGVSNFPSLDNDGDIIYLISKEGKIIHAVEYHSSWYQNGVKSNGGWTLEMIDTKNSCGAANNWIASNNAFGGTPGKKNSVDGKNPDLVTPVLLRSYATDSISITVVFNEPMDSLSTSIAANYQVSNDIGQPVSAINPGPLFNKVTLKLPQPLTVNMIYHVTAKSITDCAGNEIGAMNKIKLGLPAPVDTMDLVINEMLFNPKAGGVDYIEIYNRSNKIIDLKDIYLANRAGNGLPASPKQLSLTPRLIYPQEYLVVTENSVTVKQQYYTREQDVFLDVNTMPSYPDDKGYVLLLSAPGKILDEVDYLEKWHFKLLDNYGGVALERINYNKPSQDAGNWHSAATSIGYGTPGYQNSQFMMVESNDAMIDVAPPTFSPDNDGFNDFLTVTYRFPEPGYLSNIIIYDINGRPVKYLAGNAVCGLTGFFRWDGLDDKGSKLPVGVYIMISEVFNLKGKTKKFNNGIVLARRLNK